MKWGFEYYSSTILWYWPLNRIILEIALIFFKFWKFHFFQFCFVQYTSYIFGKIIKNLTDIFYFKGTVAWDFDADFLYLSIGLT